MKPIFKSKTLWFNFLALAVIIAGNFGFGEFTPDAWVNDMGIVAVVLINFVLRFSTNKPLGIK